MNKLYSYPTTFGVVFAVSVPAGGVAEVNIGGLPKSGEIRDFGIYDGTDGCVVNLVGSDYRQDGVTARAQHLFTAGSVVLVENRDLDEAADFNVIVKEPNQTTAAASIDKYLKAGKAGFSKVA
jgi:hypothetical protein